MCIYIYLLYIHISLWIQVSLKKILWPANCTPIAFQAADPWIHRVYMVINICIIGTPWNSTPNGNNALLDQFQGSACSQTKMVLQSFSIVMPRLHRPLPRNGVIFFMPPSLGIVSYWAMAGEHRTFCISVIGNDYRSNQSGPRYYDLVASENALAWTLICRGRNRFDKYLRFPVYGDSNHTPPKCMLSSLVRISKQQLVIHKHRQTCAGTCFRTQWCNRHQLFEEVILPLLICFNITHSIWFIFLSPKFWLGSWSVQNNNETISCSTIVPKHINVHRRGMEQKVTRHNKSRITSWIDYQPFRNLKPSIVRKRG